MAGDPVNPTLPTLRRAALAMVLALTGSSCSQGLDRTYNPFLPPAQRAGQEQIRVRVENENFNDATVRAVRGGERMRLGDVTGKTSRTFNVRWNTSLPLEFDINLIGGSGCRVRALSVDPGDLVWVRIPAQLNMTPCYSGKS